MTVSSFWTKYREEYVTLTKLGFPVMLTQLGVIVMSFADTMMVGAYGVEELASSAFVNSLFIIPMVMLSGLAAGITPLVGALFTRGDSHGMGRIARAGLQINAVVSLAFTAIMAVLYFYLDKFGQPEELLPIIRPYYLTLLTTLLPAALFNALAQTSNGVTDTKTPMWFILGAILLNILGNYLLIFGHFGFPELGLTGAGIATSAARFAGLAGIAVMYRRANRYAGCRKGMSSPGSLGEERLKVWYTSYPVMIQSGIECLLWSFGAVVCGWFGKIQLAAFQVVNTIGQLGFMLYMSFGIATSNRIANKCGLEDAAGVRRAAGAGYQLNLILATFSSALMIIFSHQLIGLFTSDVAVAATAATLVIPLVLYQYLDATQLTYINSIRGTSEVKPLLWIAIISYVAAGIPVSLLFSVVFGWECTGVYYSFNVALLIASILAYTTFRRLSTR